MQQDQPHISDPSPMKALVGELDIYLNNTNTHKDWSENVVRKLCVDGVYIVEFLLLSSKLFLKLI